MDYRLYPIAESGRVLGPPRALQAENDSEALRIACDAIESETVELWTGARLVAKLTPSPACPEADAIIVPRTASRRG